MAKLRQEAKDSAEAYRMFSFFLRFKEQRPALIIADDAQAIQIGRIFRAKVIRATQHSPRAKADAVRVMRAFKGVLRRKLA